MAEITKILLYRGALANMPLLSQGELAFATDVGQVWIGNGVMNIQVGGGTGGVASIANADGSLTVSSPTGDVDVKINLAHSNTWTTTQTIEGDLVIVTQAAFHGITIDSSAVSQYARITGVTSTGTASFTYAGNQINFDAAVLYLNGTTHFANGVGQVAARIGAGGGGILTLSAEAIGQPGYPCQYMIAANGQSAPILQILDHLNNPISAIDFDGCFSTLQAPTASAPAYAPGKIYYDTTLGKLRVGGAAGWETITSV